MIKKLDIKKELREEEFEDLIAQCEKKFIQMDNIANIALLCEEKTKEITPAKEAFILLSKTSKKEYEAISLGKTVQIHPKKGGIVAECHQTKQPFIANDVSQSFLYKEKYDNFLDFPIKDIMVIPIVDDSTEKNILAILWAVIPQGSLNQYTQKDLEYMIRFSIFIKKFFQERGSKVEDSIANTAFGNCMETYDKLKATLAREQEYFASIIHDIRTPMNGVLGFLELLQLNETDPKKKEYIETALKSGESMVALISDALDVSKISSGKMGVEKVAFSVQDELSDIAKLFYNSAGKKEIVLDVFYDPALPETIVSDYHRIKQIVNNLLNNAIKFTPAKGIIRLEMLYDASRDGLMVSVQDSGIGIAKERQKEIFTPYAQEKSSTSREYGGTGLGLSISQQLTVLLGGKLELESEEGKGSRFYFTIPCNTQKETPQSIDIQKLKNFSALIYNSQNASLPLKTAERYLKSFHMQVESVKSDVAFENLYEKKFDIFLILVDDVLANKDKIQALIDSKKSIIVVDDNHFEDKGSKFLKKAGLVKAPLLPQDLQRVILGSDEPLMGEAEKDISRLKKITGKHILVVDDNSINLKFMKEILKILHFESVSAKSGHEAIETFKNIHPDIIFMDENMPGMQGTEAIRQIREIEKKKNLKEIVIIGLTGDADKATKDELIDAGANDVLTKPIQLKQITDILTHYL